MRLARLPAIVLAIAALAGCASDKRSEALTRSLMMYGSAIRWGDYATAQGFVDPDYATDHPVSSVEQSRLAQLRVTAYDDGSGPQPDGEDEVVQVVQIGVTNINSQSDRTVVDHQRWRYDREKGRWYLMSGLPDFAPR